MNSESGSKTEPEPNPVRATWDWLLKPLVSSVPSASSDARTRLLAWFLVAVMAVAIALLILVLLVDLPEDDRRRYLSFVLGLAALVALAYGLNRGGHYPIAAGVRGGGSDGWALGICVDGSLHPTW